MTTTAAPVYDVGHNANGWYATRYGERVSAYVKTRREAQIEATERMAADLRIEESTGIRAASNTTAGDGKDDDTDTGRCVECDGELDTTFGNVCEDCTEVDSLLSLASTPSDSGAATARPWAEGGPGEVVEGVTRLYGPSDDEPNLVAEFFRESDAIFTRRAVNSFDAMRTAIGESIERLNVGITVSDLTSDPVFTFKVLDKIRKDLAAALALAEGKDAQQ